MVPNSTITNWVREFTRWAPQLRVVPFYGEQPSREIIKEYELRHSFVESGTTGAKYHVLIATYEAVTSPKDFNAVFKKTPRWEVLVVDEGQRRECCVLWKPAPTEHVVVKNDSSLIFKRLNELKSCHRVIMTGVRVYLFCLQLCLGPMFLKDASEQQHSGAIQPHELLGSK